MASSFDEAREANRKAQAALTARDRAKAAAATTNPQEDTSARIAERVRRSGDMPWTGDHGDRTYGTNTR